MIVSELVPSQLTFNHHQLTSPHLELELRKLPAAEYWQLAQAGTRATAIEAGFGLFLMWIFLVGCAKKGGRYWRVVVYVYIFIYHIYLHNWISSQPTYFVYLYMSR